MEFQTYFLRRLPRVQLPLDLPITIFYFDFIQSAYCGLKKLTYIPNEHKTLLKVFYFDFIQSECCGLKN